MFAHHLHNEDSQRYWCAHCERFTGGDTLLIALEDNWCLKGVIFRQTFWLMGKREMHLYHIILQRGNRLIQLQVIENPFVLRLLKQLGHQIVQLNAQHTKPQAQSESHLALV